MRQCLDEAMLQSYCDGELSTSVMESATLHLASCAACAAAASELEEETALLTSALAAEFAASVPTERLRQRIDAAIHGVRVANASTERAEAGFFSSLSGLFSFGSQRTFGYASLVVVMAFAAILGVVRMKSNNSQIEQTASVATENPKSEAKGEVAIVQPEDDGIPQVEIVAEKPSITTYRPATVAAKRVPRSVPVKLIPGERAYLQTIARLDSTIKSEKKAMRPALQVEYERNLAVVDRAIAATRSAAKSNPNDPDAADFMFAAYQSKVDLLNTIADARVGGRSH